jgi:hypothetical protein
MPQGSAGLIAPTAMQEGETETVSLAINRGADQSANLLGAEPSARFSTKVSGVMAAQLSGDGFDIKPPTPEVQDVSAVGGQRWDWAVTALHAPVHNLTVSVYVEADASDPANRTLLLARRYPVAVRISLWARTERFMDAATTWLGHLLKLENALWAVLTAGIVVALWKAIRRRRGNKRPPKS